MTKERLKELVPNVKWSDRLGFRISDVNKQTGDLRLAVKALCKYIDITEYWTGDEDFKLEVRAIIEQITGLKYSNIEDQDL